ncbi:unnamed protein product [Zymoseptoria tritici ST99CH_3D1]|nr:unnamed protein product [Zymoseptoria tritici ST99CH_3D1]
MARTKNPNRIVRRNGSLYKDGRLLSKGKKNGITKKKRAPPPPPPPPPKKPTSKSGGRCPSRCTECKRGHRKCDGARPCERCITVGRPQNCVYQGTQPPSAAAASTGNGSGSANTGGAGATG